MEKITLKSEVREAKKHEAKALRENKQLPVVLYGHGVDSVSLTVSYLDFEKIYRKAGGSAIVSVMIGDDERNVIISDVQYHPITGRYLHADLLQIRMDEKIKTEIPVHIEGDAPAVKEQGGILINNTTKIEIECLPGDLIHDVTVSIDGLKELHDSVTVGDIEVPENVEVLTGEDIVVVTVDAPRSEEELESLGEDINEDVDAVEGPTSASDDEDGDAEGSDDAKKDDAGSDDKAEDKE